MFLEALSLGQRLETIMVQLGNRKSGKCEISAQNRPDYVKITPQNSTDYVKTAIFAVNNIRFATWIICLEER